MNTKTRTSAYWVLSLSAFEFEKVIYRILKDNEFILEESHPSAYFDYMGTIQDRKCFIEVKLYRDIIPKLDLIKLAARRLSESDYDIWWVLILAVSSILTEDIKKEIWNEFGIIILDIIDLISLSKKNTNTYYQLQEIIIKYLRLDVDEILKLESTFKEVDIFGQIRNQTKPLKKKKSPQKWQFLFQELESIPKWKDWATQYEKKCIEILKYLFDNWRDLALWEKQKSSEDWLNRYDLLCRIISYQNTFWSEIASDFHTRYIVFEFKNYSDKIKQWQILTTEKYLFTKALRSVSFIIARNWIDENWKKTCSGALKESWKLIVTISHANILEMITLKDKWEEASDILRKLVDEMLIWINR